MTDNSVARRYAGALFALSKKEGGSAIDSRGERLAAIAQAMREEPKLGVILKSPVISIAEKKALLAAILDKLDADQILRNFCNLLADKERLGSLYDIAEWYKILHDETRGILRGRVTTAIKLAPEKQAEMKDALNKKFGKDLELTFHVEPEILGGMVLAVGDRLMDSSLRAQLGALRETLRRGI